MPKTVHLYNTTTLSQHAPRAMSSFKRAIFAIAGMLFLCLVGYTGLGWTVWSRKEWLERFLSADRRADLQIHYARVMSAVFGDDSDGDGLRDGFELYCRTNPKDPAKHPDIYLRVGDP